MLEKWLKASITTKIATVCVILGGLVGFLYSIMAIDELYDFYDSFFSPFGISADDFIPEWMWTVYAFLLYAIYLLWGWGLLRLKRWARIGCIFWGIFAIFSVKGALETPNLLLVYTVLSILAMICLLFSKKDFAKNK